MTGKKLTADITLQALRKEADSRTTQAKKIARKIEDANFAGSKLIRAYNEFAKKFNESSDVDEKLVLLNDYQAEEKRLKKCMGYDICKLIEQQVRLEGEASQIGQEISLIEWRMKKN